MWWRRAAKACRPRVDRLPCIASLRMRGWNASIAQGQDHSARQPRGRPRHQSVCDAMSTRMTPPQRPLHLVGSVPFNDADAVFRAAGAVFGPKLTRVPDGETGDRKGWIGWQRQQFAEQPALEQAAAKERAYQYRPPFRVRAGHDPAGV